MRELFIITVLTMASFVSCEADNNETKMEVSNKQKVSEVLKSIETGATEPVSYINPTKYLQHNQAVGDGLAGFGELLSLLPEGSKSKYRAYIW